MPADSNSVVEDASDKVVCPLLKDLIEEFKILSTTEDFNRVGAKVVPIFASTDKIICEMVLDKEHINYKGTLHGGLTAALTDIITARALGITVKDQGMASVEIAVSYMLPVKYGDSLQITATVLKCGRNIAFTEAEFRRKSDGKIAAKVRRDRPPKFPDVDPFRKKQSASEANQVNTPLPFFQISPVFLDELHNTE